MYKLELIQKRITLYLMEMVHLLMAGGLLIVEILYNLRISLECL